MMALLEPQDLGKQVDTIFQRVSPRHTTHIKVVDLATGEVLSQQEWLAVLPAMNTVVAPSPREVALFMAREYGLGLHPQRYAYQDGRWSPTTSEHLHYYSAHLTSQEREVYGGRLH